MTTITNEALERAVDAVCKHWNMHRPDVRRMLECGLRELIAAQPTSSAGTELPLSDDDRAVLQHLQNVLPTAGINGWHKGVEVLERVLRISLVSPEPASSAGGQEPVAYEVRYNDGMIVELCYSLAGLSNVKSVAALVYAAPVAAEAAPQAVNLRQVREFLTDCAAGAFQVADVRSARATALLAMLDSQQKESSDG